MALLGAELILSVRLVSIFSGRRNETKYQFCSCDVVVVVDPKDCDDD